MREEFVCFQPQYHFSSVKWLPLRHFISQTALLCSPSQIYAIAAHQNETLFYKLEISRQFLCVFATQPTTLAKSRRFAVARRSTFYPIRASSTEQ
jgi:hypothetical protein